MTIQTFPYLTPDLLVERGMELLPYAAMFVPALGPYIPALVALIPLVAKQCGFAREAAEILCEKINQSLGKEAPTA